jgi:hypothetical protein
MHTCCISAVSSISSASKLRVRCPWGHQQLHMTLQKRPWVHEVHDNYRYTDIHTCESNCEGLKGYYHQNLHQLFIIIYIYVIIRKEIIQISTMNGSYSTFYGSVLGWLPWESAGLIIHRCRLIHAWSTPCPCGGIPEMLVEHRRVSATLTWRQNSQMISDVEFMEHHGTNISWGCPVCSSYK